MDGLFLPTNEGFVVEWDCGKDPKIRIPQRGWKAELYTKDRSKAELKKKELESEGKKARILQCIY